MLGAGKENKIFKFWAPHAHGGVQGTYKYLFYFIGTPLICKFA